MAQFHPLQVLLASFSGWLNHKQGEVLDYLVEENRVLKEQLEGSGFGSPMNSEYDWP